jgi:hypothetical protein
MFADIIRKRSRNPEPWFYLNDKLIVKNYIKALKIKDLHVANVIDVFFNHNEIQVQKGSVLKLSNLSKCNWILYPDEPLPDLNVIKLKAKEWMDIPTFKTQEYKFLGVQPKVFTEEFIPGTDINWKFFCFKGKVVCCLVKAGAYLRRIVNLDYTHSDIEIILPNKGQLPSKPKTWNKMIEIASQLSQPFDFVRVDLYSSKEKVFFGELTFTPCAENFQVSVDEEWYQLFNHI